MKLAVVLFFLTAVFTLAQAPPATTAPAPGSTLLTLPPDTVVATIDGQKVLAVDLQAIVSMLSPEQQQAVTKNPRSFLSQYAFMRKLSTMAEKAGLDQKSPLKEQMAYNRMLALTQAQIQETQNQVSVKPEEVLKAYEANKGFFTQVRVKAIYIPFGANPPSQPTASAKKVLTEAEAKAKAEKLYAELQAGADFVKLVKENSEDSVSASKDGDFGTFRRSDQQMAGDIKAAIFVLKQGEVSKPLRQPQGYYIFRAEEIGIEPLEGVREQISESLANSRFNEWMLATQKGLDIKIVNEAVFAPLQAPAPAPVK
jgi:peptidyl-prolyl cis-trans isomerase C